MTAALAFAPTLVVAPAKPASGLPVASRPGGSVLVHVVNPMVPQLGLRRFAHCEGMTVLEAITEAGWSLPASTVLLRGGDMIRRSEWDVTPIGAAELVLLVTLPQGGKGGASQIFATIASIALAIFAPELGVALLGKELAGSVAFAGVTWGQLATVGIVLAGSTVISAMLPKPKALTNGSQGAQNPTYSLSAQSNMARLLQPIEERFGRFKFMPALSAQPSFDFVNSQQELNEEFCLGMGEFDIEEIGVANTPIWKKTEENPEGAATGNYPEINFLVMAPGESNTLFSNNQVTSTDVSNIELVGTNQDGHDWIGPYVLNPPNTVAHRIEVDLSAPGGLFHVDDKGNLKAAAVSFQVQVRKIDDLGLPVAGAEWVTVIDQTVSQATRDAIRTTYGVDLDPAGRYQVRFERTNAKATDLNTADAIGILAMRGFLPSTSGQPDTTRIAVKARSTKNLNGDSAQRFYVIATRKLPIPSIDEETGAITWSAPTATRSIAWAAAYLCKSQNGLRKTDRQVAIAKLIALDAIWTARGDRFDGVFDDGGSAWTALQAICRVGRAEPRRIGRYIDFNRDEKKLIPKAAFNPTNMLSGSFNVDYLMFDANAQDGFWIDYVDERNWEAASVWCALPDSDTDPNDAPHIQMAGIVQRDQAWREGVTMAAVNRWRRRFPNWRTELEGRVCFRGDKIVVAHWLTRSYGGGAIDLQLQGDNVFVKLSEPWDHQQMLDDAQPMLSLVTPDGFEWGPVPVEVIDDGEVSAQALVRLLDTADVLKGKYAGQQPAEWPVWYGGDQQSYERPRAMWGTANQKRLDCLMVAMKPEGGNNVTMAAVIDDPRVHYADGTIPPLDPDDDVPAPPTETNPPLPAGVDSLTISAVTVAEINQAGGVTIPPQLSFTVVGAPDAVSFDARWKWNDAADFSPEQRGLARIFQIAAVSGQLTMQVRAEGKSGFGGWFDVTKAAVGVPPDPTAPETSLVVTETSHWSYPDTSGGWSWSGDGAAIRFIVKLQWTQNDVDWFDFASFTTTETETTYPAGSRPNDVATDIRAVVQPIHLGGGTGHFIQP